MPLPATLGCRDQTRWYFPEHEHVYYPASPACCPRALSSLPSLAFPQWQDNDCFSPTVIALSSSLASHLSFPLSPKHAAAFQRNAITVYICFKEHDSGLARWLSRLRHLLPRWTQMAEGGNQLPKAVLMIELGGHSIYPKKLEIRWCPASPLPTVATVDKSLFAFCY